MNPRREQAWTIVETIVTVVVIGILIALALPLGPGGHPSKGAKTQMLSNMKRLHLATQLMALDSTTTGDTNLGWPGDMGGSFSHWANALVKSNYLSAGDLCKLLSAPGKIAKPAPRAPVANTNAVLVYAVREESASESVFLTSANFTNTPTGGTALETSAKPFGNGGFVVFRKAGDGAILMAKQVGQTNVIGGYVPLLR
jgi:type II secretory pathway pseudopilin PulG